ncbi:transglycosylase SLT domain-containing protein [Sulfurimonas sp.]|nr:transglycosylase SLT domain-containing protein [Sulfurimonas sp.]
MLKKSILLLLISIPLLAKTSNYIDEKNEFLAYKDSLNSEFTKYKEEQKKVFEAYKKELGVYWDEPKLSTKDSWLSYSKDKKTRSDVDFKNETITIETISTSKKAAEQKIKMALAKVITIDTKEAHNSDQLERKLSKIKKPLGVLTSKVDAKPILSTVIFDKMPTKKSVVRYVNNKIKPRQIKSTTSQKTKAITSNKQKPYVVYSIQVKMPQNTMIKRSRIYYQDIEKESLRQKIPKALVFAIMHSESSFNPRARSHIPAYGLMQIVPKSAGIDSYKYLYNKKRLVSGSYLYNSKNNITMGSAYLHILYYKYLRKIKNPDSRLYCTIAAYNTGAGNVAWAFTKTNNMNKAAPLINKLTPQQVYNKLMRDLKYEEPKHYLKKVSKRMSAYNKLYKS